MMKQITFPYPNWIRGFGFFLILVWGPFSFFRKYFLFDLMDPEMLMQPMSIGLVMLYFSKEKIDDERIHFLKFRALAFAVINGLLLSWVVTKFLYDRNYSVEKDFVHPISTSVFLMITILLAYGRLFYLKSRM
jgi:hypothetical protein